jgi:hypothetical protein
MNVFEDICNDPKPTLDKVKIAVVELIKSGYSFNYDSDHDVFILTKNKQVYLIARNRQKTPGYKSKKIDVLRIGSKDWRTVGNAIYLLLDEPVREKFYEENVTKIRKKRLKNLPVFKNANQPTGET